MSNSSAASRKLKEIKVVALTGAPVGMWTWGHVHTKFWQNLIKKIKFNFISIPSSRQNNHRLQFRKFYLTDFDENILRLYTFSTFFEAKENLVFENIVDYFKTCVRNL